MSKLTHSLVLFFFLLVPSGFTQPLQFVGEKIEIIVHEEYAEVRGEYHFQNHSARTIKRSLLYPFVIEENLPYPHDISVALRHDQAPIPFNRHDNRIRFSITVQSQSTDVYEVHYS